ncbi:hypothetical protein T439DRAFT_313638 [Meredithblackwellia eburnea MCA 4105]
MKATLSFLCLIFAQARATPISSLYRRAIWTTPTCTGSWEGDSNLAVSIPSGAPNFYLESPLQYAYSYSGGSNDTTLEHETFCVNKNDTCVIVITEGAKVDFDHVDVVKYGYFSDLNQASFFGVNAAVNVANGSTVTATHVNTTTHNGAAGWFTYGAGSVLNVSHSNFYATGPLSHGIYAAGNGTAYADDFTCRSEGYRSSCFSGDYPAGDLYISNSRAQTWGLGSAVAYALGKMYLTNVNGYAYQAPAVFMDGNQTLVVTDSDIEGGLFAGIVLFNSQAKGVSSANFTNSIIRSHGANVPAIEAGTTSATVYANSLSVYTESNILLCSNNSGVTQAFDRWYAPADGESANAPADVAMFVTESVLFGDLLAINGSTIDFHLSEYSVWTGSGSTSGQEPAYIGVYLDENSGWTLTADTKLQNFTVAGDSLENIASAGFNILYNQSAPANSWLGGATKALSGGGSLKPF